MRIENLTKGTMIASDVRTADRFFTRLKGLLGTRQLPAGQGLLIRPCDSVHTFGMKYAIDVVFCNRENCVVKVVEQVEPGKITMCRAGKYVLELPIGTLKNSGTMKGDFLSFTCD